MIPSGRIDRYPHGACSYRSSASSCSSAAIGTGQSDITSSGEKGLDGGYRFMRRTQVGTMPGRLHPDQHTVGQMLVHELSDGVWSDDVLRTLKHECARRNQSEIRTVVAEKRGPRKL